MKFLTALSLLLILSSINAKSAEPKVVKPIFSIIDPDRIRIHAETVASQIVKQFQGSCYPSQENQSDIASGTIKQLRGDRFDRIDFYPGTTFPNRRDPPKMIFRRFASNGIIHSVGVGRNGDRIVAIYETNYLPSLRKTIVRTDCWFWSGKKLDI